MQGAFQKLTRKTVIHKLLRIVSGVLLLLFLLAISYIILFPLFRMISDAFTPEQDAYDPSIVWVPKHPTLENFKMAYSMLNMPFAFFHTLLYQILSALIEVGVCSIVAYGLARFRFREKKLLEFILMLTILVPMPMIIIPMTVNYSQLDFLGILNLIGGLIGHDIRPNLLNTGFSF